MLDIVQIRRGQLINIFNIIICLCVFTLSGFAQHEGIERHFSSYRLTPWPEKEMRIYSDTTTDNFFNYLPQHKYTQHFFGYNSPGKPFLPMIFSERPKPHSFYFLNNYYPYIPRHHHTIYYDAQKPFTLVTFSAGAGGIELVRFLHTQNVNPTFNIGLNVGATNTDGNFMRNESKINDVSIFTAYTKRRYQSYSNFIFHKIEHFENGGITSDSIYENTDIREENMDINLHNAQNTLSQLGMHYKHEYRFGDFYTDTIKIKEDTVINYIYEGNFSIIQDLKANRYYRIYSDIPGQFYENIYNDSLNTFDSTGLRHYRHKIMLNLHLINSKEMNTSLRLMGGIRNDFYDYSIDGEAKFYQFHYLSGYLLFENPRHDFRANLNYCFAGTGILDMDINANHDYKLSENLLLSSDFNYELADPDRILFYYSSNHFNWSNDLKKSLRLGGSSSLRLKEQNLSFGVNINLLSNYVIFNKSALPEQISTANLVTDVFVDKKFKFGKFFMNNRLTYQLVSDKDNLPLPEILAYSSLYLKTPVFNNAAVFQTGLSGYYHSSAFAYAYMPATGAYYLQDTRKIGNHFMVSFHVCVQIRKFRLFVRASNLNTMFMPRNQYLMLHVPENPFGINFGVSWEFYD